MTSLAKKPLFLVWAVFGFGPAIVLLTGCGKTPEVAYAVKGKVVNADGKPVTGLVITFYPQDEVNQKNVPSGYLKDGTFNLDCLRGRYKVTIAPVPVRGGGMPGAAPKHPRHDTSWDADTLSKYRAPATTPWEVTVPEGGQVDLVFTVK